jgi:copper chaperone CopZ
MTCESCVKDISSSLFKLSGIQKVEASLKDQLVTIEGTGSSHDLPFFQRMSFVWHEAGPDVQL